MILGCAISSITRAKHGCTGRWLILRCPGSMAQVEKKVRLFGVYDVCWQFLAEVPTVPLKCFKPFSACTWMRPLCNATSVTRGHLIGRCRACGCNSPHYLLCLVAAEPVVRRSLALVTVFNLWSGGHWAWWHCLVEVTGLGDHCDQADCWPWWQCLICDQEVTGLGDNVWPVNRSQALVTVSNLWSGGHWPWWQCLASE